MNQTDSNNLNSSKKIENPLANLSESYDEIAGKISETAKGLSTRTLVVMKDYPVHTALAAAGVGFIVGAMISRKQQP